MKKNKLVVLITFVTILSMLLFSTKVFADQVTLTLKPLQTTIKEGEETTIKAAFSSIQATTGIVSFTAELEYDDKTISNNTKNSIESLGNWKVTYDEATKKISGVTNTNTPIKVAGEAFQISIKTLPGTVNKLKSQNKSGVTVALTKIEAKTGLGSITGNNTSVTVNVSNEAPGLLPTPSTVKPQPVPTPKLTPAPQKNVVEEKVTPKKNPEAGLEDAPVVAMMVIAIALVGGFISYRSMHNKR